MPQTHVLSFVFRGLIQFENGEDFFVEPLYLNVRIIFVLLRFFCIQSKVWIVNPWSFFF